MVGRIAVTTLALVALTYGVHLSAQEKGADIPAKPAVTLPKEDLSLKEQILSRQYQEFEQQLLRLKQRMERSGKQEDRDRAMVLDRVLEYCKEKSLSVKFEQMIELLKSKDFKAIPDVDNAENRSSAIAKELQTIIAMLREDTRASILRQERERLEQILKDLNKVIIDQQTVQAQTENGKTESNELKKSQDRVTDATKDIADRLGGKDGDAKNTKGDKKSQGKNGDQAGKSKDDGEQHASNAKSKDGGDSKDPKGNAKGGDGKEGDPKDPNGGKEGGKEGGDSQAKGKEGDGKEGSGKEGSAKEGGKEGGKEGKDGGAQAKEGKGGDGKDGDPKAGNSKNGGDPKAGDPKSGDPAQAKNGGDPKAGDPKSGAGDPKGGDPKAGQAKAGDPKGGDPKGGQAKAGDPKSGESGQAKSGDGKSGDPKGGKQGQAKAGESSQGQSQAKGDSQGGDPKQGGSQSPPQASNKGDGGKKGSQQAKEDIPNGKKQVEDGNYKQNQAGEQIEKKNNDGAADKQDGAVRDLEKAKKELEKLLRQIREEELERLLAALQARCEKMLAMQIEVYEGTKSIEGVTQKNEDKLPTRAEKQESLKQADKEGEIVLEASKAIEILEAEGSAVAFPEVFQQVREDMKHVQRRLNVSDTGKVTQEIEEDIIASLREMIDALKKKQQEMKDGKSKDSPPGQPAPNQDQKLLDKIAELKMIRAMQVRVNGRTQTYGKMYQGEQALEPGIRRELHNLSERQERIYEITNRIAKGDNK